MQYEIIRRVNGDSFVSVLNAAVAEGKRAVSAGASYNQQAKALEWWAIVEKRDEAQADPKDERAELLEAAEKIKRECNMGRCVECPLANGDGFCAVYGRPDMWDV